MDDELVDYRREEESCVLKTFTCIFAIVSSAVCLTHTLHTQNPGYPAYGGAEQEDYYHSD
jgi:hypothetical protein